MGAGSRSRVGLFRSRGVALVGVSVLALGACSGEDPEPRFAPPSSSAPSPSTSAVSGPVAPTMPAQARGSDATAAEAFVRFYWEMVNYAQVTGDVSGLRALGRKCVTCEKGIATVEAVYGGGGRIRGGEGSLSRFRTGFVDHEGENRAVVECTLASTKQLIDYPGVAKDKKYPGGEILFQFLLVQSANGWRVLFMGEQ